MRRVLISLMILLVLLPGWGVNLAGQEVPLALQMKDMQQGWCEVTLAGGGLLEQIAGMAMHDNPSLADSSSKNTVYTRGQVVLLGEQPYLLAYQVTSAPATPRPRMADDDGDAVPPPSEPVIITPETPLTAVLIGLRGHLQQMRPVDTNTLLRQAREKYQAELIARTQQNLGAIAQAMQRYLREHADTYPQLADAAALQAAIGPYLDRAERLRHPWTGEAYRPNASLSQRQAADITHPAELILAYELSADPDGSRYVVYVDGHVERVSAFRWAEVMQASGIE